MAKQKNRAGSTLFEDALGDEAKDAAPKKPSRAAEMAAKVDQLAAEDDPMVDASDEAREKRAGEVQEMAAGTRKRRSNRKPKPKTAKPKRAASSYTQSGNLLRSAVYFPEADWDALRVKAAQEGTTAAALIREAVAAHFGIGSGE